MIVRPPSHERLLALVERWRARQADAERALDARVADAYRHCANDLDLVLRDDDTLQPKVKR